jgi:hypothetical protein
MGLRTTLVLLLVALALGGVLWFTNATPPLVERADAPALDDRSLAQCRRVRWQFAKLRGFELVRQDDGRFGLVEPVVDRVSSGHLANIVDQWDTARLVAAELVDDERGRVDGGFLPPVATFRAEWPDGHVVTYDIGQAGPIGDDRFVRRDGKIWLTKDSVHGVLEVNEDDLRDCQVFLNQERVCDSLAVEHVGRNGNREVIGLARDKDRRWRMTLPVAGRADPTTAIRFVTAVLALRADTFLSGMIQPPERVPDVVVTAAGGPGTERLELWVEQGTAFGQLPGRIGWFQCDPRTYEAVFANEIDRLRARTLHGFDAVAEELAEIVIDLGEEHGERIHLLRESVVATPGWRLLEPVAHAASPTPANETVQAVNNLVAIEFVDGASADDPTFGLRAPKRLALGLRGFRDRQARTLWFGAATTGKGGLELVYACRADEPGTVVLVPAPAVDQLRRPFTTYCDREVLRLPVQVERVALERADGAQRSFGPAERHWQLDGVEGNRDEVRDFVNDMLRDLHGEAVLDLRGPPHGLSLGPASWTLALCRGNGDELARLRVWERGADEPLVVQPGREEQIGFRVSKLVDRQLRGLWR